MAENGCDASDTDINKSQFFWLQTSPSIDDAVDVSFTSDGSQSERLFIARGDSNAPNEYVDQVLASSPSAQTKQIKWKGGIFYFSFQKCTSGVWRDWGGLNVFQDGSNSYSLTVGGMKATVRWTPASEMPVYIVSWDAIHAFRTLSHVTDTVYATMLTNGVEFRYGPQTFHRETDCHPIGAQSGIRVARNPSATLDLKLGLVNSGHASAQDTFNGLGQVLTSIGTTVLGPSLVAEVAALFVSKGLNYLFGNCDGPIGGTHVVWSGDNLYDLTAGRDLVWQFDYSNIPSNCGGPAHYNVTGRITRASG